MRQGMEYGLKLNMHVYNNLIHAAFLDNDVMKAYCWLPHISLSRIFPQTVYCRGSQFFLKRCPARSRWWCPALGSLQFICLPVWQFICLPVWLVVSGFPDVSLRVSPLICLPVCLVVSGFPDVSFRLSPCICFPLCLGVSGSPNAFLSFSFLIPFICFLFSPTLADTPKQKTNQLGPGFDL